MMAAMPSDRADGRRFLKTFFAVVGTASLLTLVVMVVIGMERVNLGKANPLRAAWMVEVNWVAFLVFLAGFAFSLGGWILLHREEWNARMPPESRTRR